MGVSQWGFHDDTLDVWKTFAEMTVSGACSVAVMLLAAGCHMSEPQLHCQSPAVVITSH
jgi:hypothetical protein